MLAIAGDSGTGKTTVTAGLVKALGPVTVGRGDPEAGAVHDRAPGAGMKSSCTPRPGSSGSEVDKELARAGASPSDPVRVGRLEMEYDDT